MDRNRDRQAPGFSFAAMKSDRRGGPRGYQKFQSLIGGTIEVSASVNVLAECFGTTPARKPAA